MSKHSATKRTTETMYRGNLPTTYVIWRKMNKLEPGDPGYPGYRKIPQNVRVSHLAEPYERLRGIPGYKEGMRVEYVAMESAPFNLSRKSCTALCLPCFKCAPGDPSNWTLISKEEKDTFAGATWCIHGQLGTPCHMKRPSRGMIDKNGYDSCRNESWSKKRARSQRGVTTRGIRWLTWAFYSHSFT
jgi:hypothetical protein